MQHSNVRSCVRKYFSCAAIAIFFLLVSEFIARLDDRLFLGESFFSSPSFEGNLKFNDDQSIRGKPFGNFRNCNLNGYGFRGPRIDPIPSSTKARIMVIGASEVFGSCDYENMEFPAQLQSLLGKNGKYEVINASIVGMSLWSTISFWENWASRFRPDIVIVYANPLFYLGNDPILRLNEPISKLDAIPTSAVVTEKPLRFESRILFRLHGLFHFPDWINIWRKKKWLADTRDGKSQSWYLPSVPQDRYSRFREDISRLTDSIRKQNVKVVFVTHAIRTTTTDNLDDRLSLLGMLYFYPKASEELLINFNLETNRMILEYAHEKGFPVIDAAEKLNNHRELFDDLIHLNKEGAGRMARMLVEHIVPIEIARLINNEHSSRNESEINKKSTKVGSNAGVGSN